MSTAASPVKAVDVLAFVAMECRSLKRLPESRLIDAMDNLADDLGLDPADRVALYLEAERRFGVNLDSIHAFDTPTVGYVVNKILRALPAGGGVKGMGGSL